MRKLIRATSFGIIISGFLVTLASDSSLWGITTSVILFTVWLMIISTTKLDELKKG